MKNTPVSLYSFLRKRGGRVGGTERTTACYGVSRNSSSRVVVVVVVVANSFSQRARRYLTNAADAEKSWLMLSIKHAAI